LDTGRSEGEILRAMSQENVEMVRAALNTFAELDEGLVGRERVEEFFAQDVITTFSGFAGFMEEGRTLRGADEFLEFRAAWMEPYDDFLYEPVKIIDAGGNRVVATLHQRGKPHGSDSWVEMDYGLVYTVEEGLVTQADFYATPEKALKAAGLQE
jgi:ketosteroid isomerase-like protein